MLRCFGPHLLLRYEQCILGGVLLRVLEEIKGSTVKVALFDDNMKLVTPVYDFLLWQWEIGREPGTLAAYARDLKTYWEFLSFKALPYLPFTPRMLSNFIIYLQEPFHDKDVTHITASSYSRRKTNTINRILGTVYSFYTHCDWQSNADKVLVGDSNPGEKASSIFGGFLEYARRDRRDVKSYFKVKNRREDETDDDKLDEFRILSPQEYQMVLGALRNRRDILLFKFLYYSGVRISEALSLTIDIIPLPNSDHYYTAVRIKEPPAAGRRQQLKSGPRKVFVPTELIEDIDDFIVSERMAIKTSHKFVFVSQQKQNLGKVLTEEAVRQKYTSIAAKLGIPNFTPHSLRHTCCTNLIAAGIHIAKVQKVMGHKQIATTMKYEHLSNHQVLQELDSYWKRSIFLGEEVLDD